MAATRILNQRLRLELDLLSNSELATMVKFIKIDPDICSNYLQDRMETLILHQCIERELWSELIPLILRRPSSELVGNLFAADRQKEVTSLIEAGWNPQTPYLLYSLDIDYYQLPLFAVRSIGMMNLLIKAGVSINTVHNDDTLLSVLLGRFVTSKLDLELFFQAVALGATLPTRSLTEGEIIGAVTDRTGQLLSYLISQRVDLDYWMFREDEPWAKDPLLLYLLNQDNLICAKLLLQAGADTKVLVPFENEPLHVVVEQRWYQIPEKQEAVQLIRNWTREAKL